MLKFPAPLGETDTPIWTGEDFKIGTRRSKLLRYAREDTGWSEELANLLDQENAPTRPLGVASRAHVIRQLQSWMQTDDAPDILEIGCSSGYMLSDLKNTFPEAHICGTDYALTPLERLVERLEGIPVLQMDICQCPLPSQSFDAVIVLNVLEHIEDDKAALQQIYRMLRPGGIAVIEVPAGPGLIDDFDFQMGHFRRYTMSGLTKLLHEMGFSILSRSHLGFLLYPPFWLFKMRTRHMMKSEERRQEVMSSTLKKGGDRRLLHKLLGIEARMRRWFYLPVGIRCLATVHRPSGDKA